MRLRSKLIIGALLILLLAGLTGQASRMLSARAEDPTPEPYQRQVTLKVSFTFYEWWVVRWRNNEVACQLFIEHEGLPTEGEVQYYCNRTVYNEWRVTAPCPQAMDNGDVTRCPGLYLHFNYSFPSKRDVVVKLPMPKVWLNVTDCNPDPVQNRCTTVPSLVFEGEEPLPNEMVIRIQGTINGVPFSCPSDRCALPLSPTGAQGTSIEFWANSSFGDSSEKYSGLVRLVPWGDFMNPDAKASAQQLWYLDVLSDQWRGETLASCADTWRVFPEVGGPPAWLSTPLELQNLASTEAYYFLAAMLIRNGDVDVSMCDDGGLQSDIVASACGVEAAKTAMVDWQNQFDQEIINVAGETGIPAQLMKNLFSRESQIWPALYQTYKEAGLGQLTDNGADTVLLWNPEFFTQFCPLVLDQSVCDLGFGNLGEEEQLMLRGALVQEVNAGCPNCPAGIDLSQANFSIKVFAEGIQANCSQVGRILTNITGKYAGQVSSFEDLWKYTLVNYNAGSGCLSYAISAAYTAGQPLIWENVSARLEEGCQPAIDYVNDIALVPYATPTPTPWVWQDTPPPLPTFYMPVGPTPTPLPVRATPTRTPSSIVPTPTGPTRTPTLTVTPGGPTVTPFPTEPYPVSTTQSPGTQPPY